MLGTTRLHTTIFTPEGPPYLFSTSQSDSWWRDSSGSPVRGRPAGGTGPGVNQVWRSVRRPVTRYVMAWRKATRAGACIDYTSSWRRTAVLYATTPSANSWSDLTKRLMALLPAAICIMVMRDVLPVTRPRLLPPYDSSSQPRHSCFEVMVL